MKVNPRQKLIIAVASTTLISASIAWAAFSLNVSAGIRVTVPGPSPETSAVLTGVSLNGIACTINSAGDSASCPKDSGNILVGQTIVLSVTVANTGVINAPLTVNPTSDAPGIATINAIPGNSNDVSPGSSVTLGFTVTGVSAGSADVGLTISG